jgi:hypothetical protein
LPEASSISVSSLTTYDLSNSSGASGVKVTVLPLTAKSPSTGVCPAGPAGTTEKDVDVTVAASIGLEKVTEIGVVRSVLRAPVPGVVAVTTGPLGPEGSSSEHAVAAKVSARASEPRGR